MTWRRFGFLTLSLLFITSCTSRKESKNIPVLSVNGQTFSAAEVGHRLAKRLKNYDALAAKDPTNVKRAREGILQELIVVALLQQYAKTHQLTITDDDLEKEFDRIRKTYPDDLTFRASLAGEGQSLGEWKKKLRESLLEKKVFDDLAPAKPNANRDAEEEARKYYENHHSEFEHPASVHLQQLVVTREDDAERLSHKLKAGASFSDLAKKFSISPDAPKGGDVGYIYKGSVAAFDAAFGMKPGQTSGVVKSSYGFHIMKVLDKRPPGRTPFEEVKPRLLRRIAARVQQNLFNRWLEDSVKSAKIDRNDGLLDRIRVRTEAEEE